MMKVAIAGFLSLLLVTFAVAQSSHDVPMAPDPVLLDVPIPIEPVVIEEVAPLPPPPPALHLPSVTTDFMAR
jgi:hypothetical protein